MCKASLILSWKDVEAVFMSIHVVFILYRLAVLFAFETEDGCRSSETCIPNLKTIY